MNTEAVKNKSPWIKLGIAGIIGATIVLLTVTLSDRSLTCEGSKYKKDWSVKCSLNDPPVEDKQLTKKKSQ